MLDPHDAEIVDTEVRSRKSEEPPTDNYLGVVLPIPQTRRNFSRGYVLMTSAFVNHPRRATFNPD